MTYDVAQAAAQLIASGLFLIVLAGVGTYVFRPANKASFERAARLPLNTDNPQQER
jgi:cbb3-type cytochrome oxidase subunit 3